MTSKTQRARKGAFTLIELLTVIAIIGILAAIIIPTVGAVRNKAKGVRCASNLRQIGVAIRGFANDNKGMIVPYRGEPTSAENDTPILWTEYLVPYMSIKTPDGKMPTLADGSDYKEDSRFFYMCPSSPVPVNWRAWGNYALHPVVMKATGSKKPNFPITKVQRPSQLILIADGSVFTGEGLNGGASDDNSGQYFNKTYPFTADPSNILNAPVAAEAANPNADGAIGWFRYRHNNTVNCLYLDGHVSNIPYGNRPKEVTFAKFVFSR
jgi:prepilin-type N-terminal cleavage/methylation domain-containing protein/prepilin-type processing-associated H-X9-DG protein